MTLIDLYGNENRRMFPCFKRLALTDLIEAKSLTWHYYQAHPKAGLWNAPDAILPIRRSAYFKTDVRGALIADLRRYCVTELGKCRVGHPHHGGFRSRRTKRWLRSSVGCIDRQCDRRKSLLGPHRNLRRLGRLGRLVRPCGAALLYNSYELGFRVPLIAIGPYAKKGYVSHHQHEFGSILRFVENAFGLGSLGTTDLRADDLSDCFNFSRPARTFVPIPTGHGPNYFLRQPISLRDPDDDF